MFHCYRPARQDDDNIALLSCDTSMVSLIKTHSNYSTVLTIAPPFSLQCTNKSKKQVILKLKKLKGEKRRVKCDNVRCFRRFCLAGYMKTAFSDVSLTHFEEVSPLPSVSIHVPMVLPAGGVTVSYGRKDNLLSIRAPKERTVIENSISQMKWMASEKGISGTSNICDNLTTDITPKCADMELYRSVRAEEEAEITSCNVSVSVSTMAQSRHIEHRTIPKTKQFPNWKKMSSKILECNCFSGRRKCNHDDD